MNGLTSTGQGTYRTFFQYWTEEPRTFSQKATGEPIDPFPSIGLIDPFPSTGLRNLQNLFQVLHGWGI